MSKIQLGSIAPELWMFEKVRPHHGPQHHAAEMSWAQPRGSRDLGYEAAKHIWGIQHSLHLDKSTSTALINAVWAMLQGAGAIQVGKPMDPWLALVRAQQCAWEGRHDDAAKDILGLFEHVDSEDANPERLACALIGRFHLTLARLCPFNADLADAPVTSTRTRAEQYGQWLAPSIDLLARLQGAQDQLPRKLQAQIERISLVVYASQGAIKNSTGHHRLVADLTAPAFDIQLAYGALGAGLVALFNQEAVRARICFEMLVQRAQDIGWRFGEWVGRVELHALEQPTHPPSQRTVAAHDAMGGVIQSWAERIPEQATQAQSPSQPSLDMPGRVAAAQAWIEAHIDQGFTVTDIANHCGVTTRTLSQDFKAVMQCSPLEYVNQRKVNHAKALMDEGLDLRSVATKVGFDSVLGFVKAYARVFGQNPNTKQ
jgi:AraC-like DNA-binding protein